jgi:hypothetical protein
MNEELSYEVNEAFEKLDKGELPSKSEIIALKYAAGYQFPVSRERLAAVFDDLGQIFRKAK